MSFTIKLPFSGQSVRATQLTGNHAVAKVVSGTATATDHIGRDASAYDFALDIGTPVLALGSGTIVSYFNGVQDNQYTSANPYGNFVTIAYDMGSANTLYATYAHLKQNSFKTDGHVKAGDTVGLVGLTGLTNGPHLHIQFGLSTTAATGGGAKANAHGNFDNFDIVTFGDPTDWSLKQYPTDTEYQYTFSSALTLADQVHAYPISLLNDAFSVTGSVGSGFGTETWNGDDYYSFVAPSNGALSIHLTGVSHELDLRLIDSNGQRLNQSINDGTSAQEIAQFVTGGSTYLIHIDPLNYDASNYSLDVSFHSTDVAYATGSSALGKTDYYDHQGGALIEERSNGDMNWRNNNPGNIVFVAPGYLGGIGDFSNPYNGRHYEIFPDYATGFQAMLTLLKGSTYKGENLTIQTALNVWVNGPAHASLSPGQNYVTAVENSVRLPLSTPLSALSDTDFVNLALGIEKGEGDTVGQVSHSAGPTVASITSSPSSGVLNAGKSITLTLNVSGPLIVSGTPTLHLNDGGVASYDHTSGTELVFNYTVTTGQNTASLAVTGVNLLNGATITDGAGNSPDLSGAIKTVGSLRIDTTLPNAASPTLTVPQNSAPTAIGIAAPSDPDDDALTVMVTALPSNGTVLLSDGVTSVTQGEILTSTQLTSLQFKPTTEPPRVCRRLFRLSHAAMAGSCGMA